MIGPNGAGGCSVSWIWGLVSAGGCGEARTIGGLVIGITLTGGRICSGSGGVNVPGAFSVPGCPGMGPVLPGIVSMGRRAAGLAAGAYSAIIRWNVFAVFGS